MKRKLALSSSIIVFVIALLSVGTIAYFTMTKTVDNTITAGNLNLEIREVNADGEAVPADGIQIMPGDTVSHVMSVENTGDHPFFVRVKLSKEIEDSTLSAEDCISMNINNADWTYSGGYYYYNKTLTPGESTKPLFTQVEIDGEKVGNEYLGKTLTLNVAASVVQSDNNGIDPLNAAGWPEI